MRYCTTALRLVSYVSEVVCFACLFVVQFVNISAGARYTISIMLSSFNQHHVVIQFFQF